MPLRDYIQRYEDGGDVTRETDEVAGTDDSATSAAPATASKKSPLQQQVSHLAGNPEVQAERDSRLRAYYDKQLADIQQRENSFGESSGINEVLAQFGAPPGAEDTWARQRSTELAAREKGKQEAMTGIGNLDTLKAQIATTKTVTDLLKSGRPEDREKATLLAPELVKTINQAGDVGLTNDIRNYNQAVKQGYKGSLEQFMTDLRKAGSTKVSVDASAAKSVAGQIGDIVKESRDKTIAAEKSDESADRILTAIDSNKLIAGPLANQRLTIAQVGDFLGVKGDTQQRLIETRNAMQGLAQLTLQGRQEMKGQGAITENESKLAERAVSGDITLTPTELRVLANAAKRAANYQREQHGHLMKTMSENPQMAQLVPFYTVHTKSREAPAKPAAPASKDTKASPAAAPKPVATNDLQTALKQQGIPYEPDKFDYRINPTTGAVQSKPKVK